MAGLAQTIGGITGVTSSGVPNIVTPQAFNPFDLNSILNIGLSPTQEALVDFTGEQQDIRTGDIYSRLGLGGSTMEAQDKGGNELARLAQEQSMLSANQQVALQVDQGTLNAEQLISQNQLTAQGQALTAQNQAFNQSNTSLNQLVSGLGKLFA